MRIVIAFVVFIVMLSPTTGAAQKRVYLTEEKALEKVLGKTVTTREQTISLSGAEADMLESEFNITILDSVYIFHQAVEDGNVVRSAVIMNILGQHQPITFIVGILPDGEVDRVEIMVYRESRGSEVRRGAFLKQFEKKSLDDPIRVHDDIKNITGATISSRAVSDGVRLALWLHQRLLVPEEGESP